MYYEFEELLAYLNKLSFQELLSAIGIDSEKYNIRRHKNHKKWSQTE